MAEKLTDEVLKKIKPTKKEIEKIQKLAKVLIDKIKKEGYEAVLVGSVARNTFVSGENDIDIFVFFPKKTTREALEKKGVELGKKILKKHKPVTHYAEHPYVRANVKGYMVEIVPCYKIKKKIISAVDRSPLHNDFMKENLKSKQADEVILLKQFLKTIKAYGAEQKTKGFSGYLCELLVLYYDSFDKVLKMVAEKWDKRIVIDIKKLRENYDKFPEALVVIDPVDKERNVASAVDRTTLSKFILAARQYLEEPSKDLFFKPKKRIDLKKEMKGRKILLVSFGCPSVIEEILWSQLERLTKIIKKQLYENEFKVYRTKYWTDEKKKCVMLFELVDYELNAYKKHKGPEIWDKTHVKAFLEKNKKYWIKRSRLYAWKTREFRDARELIESLLKEEDLVPSHLRSVVKKHKIRLGGKALKEKGVLREYFGEI